MIEQNTVFIAMRENCKSGYLLHGNRKLIIRALPQGLNIQLGVPISINFFEM